VNDYVIKKFDLLNFDMIQKVTIGIQVLALIAAIILSRETIRLNKESLRITEELIRRNEESINMNKRTQRRNECRNELERLGEHRT
jgi:hypothetical protein